MPSIISYSPLGSSESEGNTHDKAPAYVLALLLTILKTLPFIGIVQTLSSTHNEKFKPCSFQTCTLWSFTNSDRQHPSTVNWRPKLNIFHTVRNGDTGLNPPADGYMPPLCPGNTSTSMKELCQTRAVRADIVNVMASSYFKLLYLVCCGFWFGSKLLHDWCLIYGLAERVTIHIGMWSWVFEALGAAVCFFWCHDASGVFVSPIVGDHCACYYIITDVECAVAMTTPMYLLIRLLFKLEKILRSTMFGDFLYFAQYDVPFFIVKESLQQPMDPYIVATTHGARLSARQQMTGLVTNDLTKCLLFFKWALKPLSIAVSLIVSMAFFPISVRFLNLLHVRYQEFWREGVVAVILVYATGMYLRGEIGCLFDFHTCSWQAKLRHKTKHKFVRSMFLHTARVLVTSCAASVMLVLLFHSAYTSNELTPRDFLFWSLSSPIFMYHMIAATYRWRVKCVVRAMKMKVGDFSVPPEEYIRMANKYPEFGLDDEKALAEQALQGQIKREEWSSLRKAVALKRISKSENSSPQTD